MSKTSCLLTPTLAKNKTTTVDKKTWHNLPGSSASMALYHGARSSDAPIVLITHDTPSALKLSQELHSLRTDDDDLPIYLFPDWETLPYDSFSPHQDIISDRLKTLDQLGKIKQGILVISAQTLMQRVPPESFIGRYVFSIKNGATLDLNKLKEKLAHAGYQHVDTVYEHGEFAVRGSLIDVFPMGSSNSYRIELFDDEIELSEKYP